MKQKHFIDIHKGLNSVFILFLMYFYNIWDNQMAWIYLALHGTYGFLWITKSNIFPDKQWENKTSLLYGLFIWFGLSLYWISPYIIITEKHFIPLKFSDHPIFIFFCISLYFIGVFIHFTSDMQKFSYLKLNPGNLITDGMFKKSRNTNYLGEFFIYIGFTLLAKDLLPLLALLLFIFAIWIPNMLRKDRSLSKYSNFKEYKKQSSRIFPYIF